MRQLILDNPVVTKELRGRMRGTRTPWLLFGYLLLLSLILFFSYLGWWNSNAQTLQNGGGGEAGYTVGRLFFRIIFYSQAVMIALITPALTAGAISVEREQRTFEMLRGTTLRPGSIVVGKLLSSVSFVALLLTSSLPLLSLCFLLGGVSPGEVFFAYVLLVGDAFLFGAIGLCWSAYAASTATATVLSYATLILFFVVTFPFAYPAIGSALGNGFGGPQTFGLCALNPLGAVSGAVFAEHYYGLTLPAWVPALLINGTLTALLVLACVNRLEDFPTRRAAPLRLVTLLLAALLVFFGDGLIMGAIRGFGQFGSAQVLLPLLLLAATLILLFVPVLVTGDREGWGGRVPSVFHTLAPRRVFGDATLPSGLPLAWLLCAVVLGGTWAAASWGLSGANLQVRTPGVAAQHGFTASQAIHAQSAAASWPALVAQTAAMLALVVFGIAGLGFLLSVLLRNRWASLVVLFLALILALALPFFTYMTLGSTDAHLALHSFGINSLYLCPLVPLYEMGASLMPGAQGNLQGTVLPGLIGYGTTPLWVGTALVYFVIGFVSYAAALLVLGRQKTPPARSSLPPLSEEGKDK